MTTWANETAKHIIKYATAHIHTIDQHPFGLFYLENLRKGEEQISLMDEYHVINLDRQITNDERYHAYLGKRHTLIDLGKYKSFYEIVICSLKHDTFLILDCEPCRILDRFKLKMYNNLKILVYKKLYEYYYMEDIDYNSVV